MIRILRIKALREAYEEAVKFSVSEQSEYFKGWWAGRAMALSSILNGNSLALSIEPRKELLKSPGPESLGEEAA